jgi:pimeloyl-ACP methyl ester carboxylesterase
MLMEQPEVDKDDITLIGHSEGAIMAPRIASKQPQDVKNVVLMGASSQTLYDLVIEKTNRNLARNYWDDDKDGRLSLEEVIVHPEAGLTIQIQPTIEIIGNLTTQNILTLQGEKDIQTNIEQALLLYKIMYWPIFMLGSKIRS